MVLILELLFAILILIETIYENIMEKKFQKKNFKSQLEKEKLLKKNNGTIKYIFIDLVEFKQLEAQKLAESKKLKSNAKRVKIPEEQRLSKNQVVPKPPQNKLKFPKKEKKDQKRLKKVRKRRMVTKIQKKKIIKPK